MNQHSMQIDWLLDSDPAIRWQVLRDLLHAPADQVAAERARVATVGWGAHLLSLQAPDGTWGGAAWNRGWNSTMHVLMLLRDFGLDPASNQSRRALGLVREQVTWQGDPSYAGNPFFAGEVEPCINGQVGAVGAYFGQDVRGIIERLLSEQLPDGGWNCEAPGGSRRSSFNTTIDVLEALLGDTERGRRGEEYLLERRLFHRLSTGAVIERDRKGGGAWTSFAFPTWWHYDVLRGLEYFRRAGGKKDAGVPDAVVPDVRLSDAIALVESKRGADGRWLLDTQYPGTLPVDMGESVGQPSRWITLRALRVLEWYRG